MSGSGNIFLKLEGVDGESKVKGFEGTIDVTAWSWGMSQPGSMHTGGGGGAGNVNIQDLSFSHNMDKSSPNLMLFCSKGTHITEAELTVRKPGGDAPVEYLKIIMKPCMITSVATGGANGEEVLVENVTLSFSEVKVTYTEQASDGAAGKGIEYGWDIEQNVPI